MNTLHQYLLRSFIGVLLLTAASLASATMRVHDVLLDAPLKTPVDQQGEPLDINVSLSAMGHDIVLQLQASRLNRVAKLNGMSNSSLPTLYEGTIEGDANSWVRISVDDGIANGHLFHYGKLLQLESRTNIQGLITDNDGDSPLVLLETASSLGAAPLLRSLNFATDKEQYAPTYPLSDNPLFHKNDRTTLARSVTSKSGIGTVVTRAIRVGVVVDSRFNESHQNRGLARALSIINSVDAIYQSQLGIAVIVEGIRVYDDPETDPMRNSSGTVDSILAQYRPIRNTDDRLPQDLTLVHLFSGHRDPERVIGLGWISTACRLDGFDLSLSTPFPFDALLAAHEIAHNLGALHDDNPQCLAKPDDPQTTLMWPELSGNSTAEFSACSTRLMQASIGASCNLDNIDVGIRLSTFPSGESLRRSVIIQVTNKDPNNRATEIASTTLFPFGTIIENISAGCTVIGATLTCNHGTLTAQTTHSMSVTATLLNGSGENVQTELELLNATDVNADDNRAVIQLLTFDETTGEAIAASSSRFDDNSVFQDDTVGGFGSISLSVLALLLFVLGRTKQLLSPTRQQARPTS